MHVSEYEKKTIIKSIRNTDPAAKVWLFDSQTGSHKKGGGIYIVIISEYLHKHFMDEMQLRRSISDRIGEQEIEIISPKDKEETFSKFDIAKGILLYG